MTESSQDKKPTADTALCKLSQIVSISVIESPVTLAMTSVDIPPWHFFSFLLRLLPLVLLLVLPLVLYPILFYTPLPCPQHIRGGGHSYNRYAPYARYPRTYRSLPAGQAYKKTKVSHLPFYWLSRIIKHCNILIDNLLTFCK